MDFASLIGFLMIYYVRPQEMFPWMQPFKPVSLVMAFALLAMLHEHRGLKLRDLFKTPHDWIMFTYVLWMIVTARNPAAVIGDSYPLYLFYLVTVQALTSIERVRVFLLWWAVMVFLLAGMSVLSQFGFDPTGSYDLTMGKMKGRLSFNTSLFDNPNALGHSVVPVIVMCYFLFIWKRPIFVRIGSIPLFAVPIYCVYLTLSKGAFIAGFATLVGALLFGRHKITQIVILVLALTTGWTAVKTLPRMQEMQSSKKDEAIQGRVVAFKFGYSKVVGTTFGVGKGNFVDRLFNEKGIYKAPHSSYVAVGTELGRYGLGLFLGVMYCCLRTLVTAKTRDVSEERIRRLLFSMIIAFMVSSWMVDFDYRATYFMMAGAVAAFHRLLLPRIPDEDEDEETVEETLQSIPAFAGPLQSGRAPAGMMAQSAITETVISIPGTPGGQHDEPDEALPPALTWRRIGLVDIISIVLITWGTIKFWHYIMNHM